MIIELLLQHAVGNHVVDGGVMDGTAGVVGLRLAVIQLLNCAHTHLVHYF